MKKTALFITFTLIWVIVTGFLYAQTIPADSLYMGQTPPGSIPKIFKLSVNSGSFAAERIAISNDGKEIYYSEVHSYYPTAGDTIKYYRYTDVGWTGPFNLFNNFLAPAFSTTGDTMFFQNNSTIYETFLSLKNGSGWGSPKRILAGLNSAHYFQVTKKGNYFISSVSNPSLGSSDWCKVEINGNDTSAVSLGVPINTNRDNLDFYIARDESFMITTSPKGLCVCFHNENGTWTNPKNLGPAINFGLGMWGPFVTADQKYLFYTTGTKPDYSDTYVYWVRIDNLIDSLKHTNFIPYLNKRIPDQSGLVGNLYNFTVPDNTFIDDDGNSTLTYSATLSNGNPLPDWLSFDPSTRILRGTPPEEINLNIKIKAVDSYDASVTCTFAINLIVTEIEKTEESVPESFRLYQNYPNPFNPTTTIQYYVPERSGVIIKVLDIKGEEITELLNETKEKGRYSIDFNGYSLPSGVYFYCLQAGGFTDTKKFILLK